MTWSDDDDRARVVFELRVAMRQHMGINTEGLTDDEVVSIFEGRMRAVAERMAPIAKRLRDAGLLPPEDVA
jgi:hypothetical protein